MAPTAKDRDCGVSRRVVFRESETAGPSPHHSGSDTSSSSELLSSAENDEEEQLVDRDARLLRFFETVTSLSYQLFVAAFVTDDITRKKEAPLPRGVSDALIER